MASDSNEIVVPLSRDNPFKLLAGGRRAFKEVPGLRKHLLVGFGLLYVISAVVGVVAVGGLYYLLLEPWAAGMAQWSAGEGFWAGLISGLVHGLIWIVEGVLFAGTVVLSFLISLSMMSVWFETLVARIISHHRGEQGDDTPFSIAVWAGAIGRSLLDSLGLLGMAVLAMALGFVPVIGPFLVIAVQGYLLGREVRDPYIYVRMEHGEEAKPLRRGLFLWTVVIGLIPFALALIPVVGWLLLPAAMIYLVAGVAWQSEKARTGYQG